VRRSVSAAAARKSSRLLPGTTDQPEEPRELRKYTDLNAFRELIVMLLSFWEYLRRRTAESVLLGIQDAIAATERPTTEVASSALVLELEISAQEPAKTDEASRQPSAAAIQQAPADGATPRRRGRPRKHPTTP
jgi:hypothetical protein